MAGGRTRILPAESHIAGVEARIDNLIRLVDAGGKTKVCAAYVYTGPDILFGALKSRYPAGSSLVINEDLHKERAGIWIAMDFMAGYNWQRGETLAESRLTATRLPCITIDLPWRPEFADGADPPLRLSLHEYRRPRLRENHSRRPLIK